MTKATNRIEITLSDERLAALDEARGNEARASFIKRATDKLIDEVAQFAAWEPITARLIDVRTGEETPVRQGGTYDSHPHRNVSAKPAAARKPRPKGGKR